MPAFSDYSATPGLIMTIGGLSVAENSTALASLNNICREITANGRQLYDLYSAIGDPMPESGGAFTGDITRSGRGGYYSADDSGYAAPRIYVLVDGSPAPTSPPNGSLAFYHAA